MFLNKKQIILFFFIFINGCSFSNFETIQNKIIHKIDINTPNDKHNIIFRENLKRNFNSRNIGTAMYILNTDISFISTKTSSINNINTLETTRAKVNYSLIDASSNKLISNGSITTSPTLGSSSSSLYTNDVSSQHVKSRLNLNSAKKLYLRLTMILKKY